MVPSPARLAAATSGTEGLQQAVRRRRGDEVVDERVDVALLDVGGRDGDLAADGRDEEVDELGRGRGAAGLVAVGPLAGRGLDGVRVLEDDGCGFFLFGGEKEKRN